MTICVSSSDTEPRAIMRKRRSSESDPRPTPSAILETADTAARRIWLANPYRSRAGNTSVAR
jgi:hypothetical protein